MASLVPPSPRAADAKRPRYLVVALVTALAFGFGCWTDGCARLTFYRGDKDFGAAHNSMIKDDGDRSKADALYRKFVEIADATRKRVIPMASASFVLGAALLAIAARGLAGRSNARSALMQVVAAQAAVVVASHFVTAEYREAERDWQMDRELLVRKEKMRPDEYAQLVPMMSDMRRYVFPGWLVIRTIASGLIVIALSRPRSREFFEAAAGQAAER